MVQHFRRFMQGRYGMDSLNIALLCVALCLAFFSGTSFTAYFVFLYPAVLVVVLYRALSRDLYSRQQEEQVFRRLGARVNAWWQLRRTMWRERREYRYFTCPHCKRVLRVPRGRGKIEITCSGCRNHFVRKT
ncbi:MAG: hypothetical protein ACOX7F_06865 [Eubacteriales bacterium]